MDCPALRAFLLPDAKILYIGIYITARRTGLTGREPAAYLYEIFALPFQLILHHGKELPPCHGGYLFCQVVIFYHAPDVQVLTEESTAAVRDAAAQLILEVFPLVDKFPVFRGYLFLCLFPILRAGMGFPVVLFS